MTRDTPPSRSLLDRLPVTGVRVVAAAYWVALAVGTHWPRLDLGQPDPRWAGVLELDKLAHVVGFGGLALMLALARPMGRRAAWPGQVLAATVVAGCYALLDELTQGWMAQWLLRTFSASDIIASLGGVLGVFIVLVTPAAPTAQRWWATLATWAVRVLGLALLPGLLFLTLAPAGNRMIAQFAREFALGRIDRAAHFVMVFLVVAVLAGSRVAGRRRPRLSALITLLGVAAAGPAIEFLQLYTGRGFEPLDVYYHMLGLLTAIGIWSLLLAGRVVAGEPMPDLDALPRPAAPPGVLDPVPEQPADDQSFISHAMLVSGLTLVSRLTGLVRDAVLAAAFGLSWVSDAFNIGFLVPNLFRRLFGEGALTASFIPQYAQLVKDDPQLARRFASVVLAALTVGLALLTLAGEAALAAGLFAAEPDAHHALSLQLTMIMLPYMPLVCLTAFLGGAMQVHGRFGPPAAVPVVLNLVIIATALIAAAGLPRNTGQATLAVYVAISVLVAGAIQLAWQVMAIRRCTRLTLQWSGTRGPLRAMGRMLGPMVFGLAVFQVNSFMDALIAYGLSAPQGSDKLQLLGWSVEAPIRTGAVAALHWAQRLYQFPLGVFAIAIATAIYPALSRVAGDRATFRDILQRGLRLTVFIALPAGVGLVLLREPLSRVIYERYAFSYDDSLRVAAILMGYSSSIWAYAMAQVLTRAFYAQQDARSPLRVAMAMVAFNFVLNLVLIWPLGAAGLAWSTAISAALQVMALLWLVRRHTGALLDRTLLGSWARIAVLAAVMAAVLGPVVGWTYRPGESLWLTAAMLAGWVSLGAGVYLGGALVTGSPELRWLLRRRV